MRSIPSLTCLTLLLATSGAAAAQNRVPVETRLGLDLLTSSIAPGAADSAGIGSRAFGAQVTGSLIAFRFLTLNADGAVILMRDERSYTQQTTQGEKESSVGAGMGSLSAGLRTPSFSLGSDTPLMVAAGVNTGRSWVDVNRTITQCIDCHAEDVEVRAGNFWEPVLHVNTGRGAYSARYRMYRGDSDFRDALIVGYTVALPGRKPQTMEVPVAPANP
jgi:hypothetical protein